MFKDYYLNWSKCVSIIKKHNIINAKICYKFETAISRTQFFKDARPVLGTRSPYHYGSYKDPLSDSFPKPPIILYDMRTGNEYQCFDEYFKGMEIHDDWPEKALNELGDYGMIREESPINFHYPNLSMINNALTEEEIEMERNFFILKHHYGPYEYTVLYNPYSKEFVNPFIQEAWLAWKFRASLHKIGWNPYEWIEQ